MSTTTTPDAPGTAAPPRGHRPVAGPGTGPPRRSALRWAFADSWVVARRNLLHVRRQPQLIIFSTVQPVMFVLLFNYVFGGAIRIPGVDYTTFLLPGVFTQTALFGATMTGIGLNDDLRKGIIDRFRSLPMARSAVLAGRTLADLVRNAMVMLLMVGVGYAIGFRFQGGLLYAMAAIALVLLMGYAFSWISANIGLRAPNAEAAQAAGFIWVFPLVFASSAFVPTETMPSWLRGFADNTPVTAVVNGMRSLVLGDEATAALGIGTGSVGRNVLAAVVWSLAILAVFAPLAVRGYRRKV